MANPLVLNSHGQDETGDMSPEKSPPDKDRTPAQERVVVDPSVKLGQPVLQSSGRLVGEVLERLAEATSFDELLKADPALSLAGLKAALKCAAETVRERNSLDHVSPEQLHGAHPVTLPPATPEAERQPALAVRTFQPDATEVTLIRHSEPPAEGCRAWFPAAAQDDSPAPIAEASLEVPMERIHPDGVFEAVFPGETQPFPYTLSVTDSTGHAHTDATPYGLPPSLAADDLAALAPAGKNADAPATDPAAQLYRHLGAHLCSQHGLDGVRFAVWAPHARQISVVGDFNGWDGRVHPMRRVAGTGVWELFVPGLDDGQLYKYRIVPQDGGPAIDKADPFAFATQRRPDTASVVHDPSRFRWHDDAWLKDRRTHQTLQRPLAVYEVHLGSWRRPSSPDNAKDHVWYTYREIADQLVPYVREMGYTHLELLPVSEHPFDGSWGYQVTGFFAPTARFGTPDDFRHLVDAAHRAGLGVIVDWVPAHFPKDAHGLARFDGSCLYEHPDPRRSENYEWGTLAFNTERPEVAAFLCANALFWVEQYHIDGLRVDAVSSMLYLDYSRQHWLPNEHGGRENLHAMAFFRRINRLLHQTHPGVLMIAEESTAWPKVTGRDAADSLGFDLKWNMGWMHDTLGYMQRDPVHRRFHHKNLTFSMVYAFTENFILPFSHDEVVHGKRSMLSKMPGDEWQRFANLRALYGYMYAHPGKKLHFMGDEFGALREWDENTELDWSLLKRRRHSALQAYVRELNRLYTSHPALHEVDVGWQGFQWLDCDDADRSTLSFIRRSADGQHELVFVANLTPVPREKFRLGVPQAGHYRELLNSDATAFGGSGTGAPGLLATQPHALHGQAQSIELTLPPLASVYLVREAEAQTVSPARRTRRKR